MNLQAVVAEGVHGDAPTIFGAAITLKPDCWGSKIIFTPALRPSRTAFPEARFASVALIGEPPIVVAPVPWALRFEMVAVVFPGVVPVPMVLVMLASEGVKFDVAVTVVPGEYCVDSEAPNEVLVPNDRFDFEPVCNDMLIVCPFGAGVTSGSFCPNDRPALRTSKPAAML